MSGDNGDGERSLVRKDAGTIAARRLAEYDLYDSGYRSASLIVAAMSRNAATRHFLEGQKDPVGMVQDDLDLRDDERERSSARTFGLPALAKFHGTLDLAETHTLRRLSALPISHPQRAREIDRLIHIGILRATVGGLDPTRTTFRVDIIRSAALKLAADDPEAAAAIEAEFTAVAGPSRGGGQFAKVDAYTFATHEDYCNLDLSDKPMERIALVDFMKAGSGYQELDAICGMRVGKGTTGSIIAWYEIYGLAELSDPQRYYGLAPGQTIGTANMAMSESQARLNVFKHCLDRINNGGRWFQELREHLDEHRHGWQQTMRMDLIKDLAMLCGHSSAKSMVGGTNICVLFDELCKFKTSEGKDNAQDVYAQMKATTASFGEDGRVVVLASPEWTGDYGMQLLKMALETDDMNIADRCPTCRVKAEQPDYEPSSRKSHPKMMGIHMTSWEGNEALSFDQLWEQHQGEANPRAFWRDFGAKPSEAKEGYYPNPERWDEQGDPDLFYPYDKQGRLLKTFEPCCDSRRYVHVDLALTRDSCGIAMAHKPVPGCPWHEKVLDKKKGEQVPNPRARTVVLDAAVQVKPGRASRGESPEIDFDAIRDLIRAWAERGFKIKPGRVTLDGWQSVDFRQILRKEGYKTREFSLDRDLKGHDTLQELINTDQLAYWPHPVLCREGRALELKSGRKVDHPEGGSKDVIDAVAGCVYHAYKEGGRTVFVG